MGKTYLAEDIAKDRECVIQQLALEVWQVEERHKAKERFEKQVRRMQEGERDKIPKVLAYFEEKESLYLVQDYIQGPTLREELKQQGIFSETQVREIWRSLLKILKVAHDRHIIHRDIKPENIIRAHPSTPLPEGEPAAAQSLSGEELSPIPEKNPREWVLVGFDLGKPTFSNFSSLFSPKSNPTSQKPSSPIPNPLFTPEPAKTAFGYRAMELQKGQAIPASDLYSLGCVGFYLLTAVDPLELWRMEGYAWTSRWRSHLKQPASQELVGILDKLLQPKLALRYQSVEEVLADLDIEPRSQTAQPTTEPVPESLQVLPGEPALKDEATEESEDFWREAAKAEAIAKAAPPEILSPETTSPEMLSLPVPDSLQVLPGEPALKEEETKEPEDLWREAANAEAIAKAAPLETAAPETLYPETVSPEVESPEAVKAEPIAKAAPPETVSPETLSPETLSPETVSSESAVSSEAAKAESIAAAPETLSPETVSSESVSSQAAKAESIAKQIAEAEAEPKAVDIALFPVDVSKGEVSEESPPEIAPSKSKLEEELAERKLDRLAIRRRKKRRFQKKLFAAMAVLISGGLAVAAIGELNRRGGFAVFGKSKNVFSKKAAIANTLNAHADAVNAVAITPDGQTLISASSDNTIGIWNLKTGKLQKTLTGHTYLLNCLATSADGKIIASGGFDKTIRIWNLDTGELMQTISRNSVGIDALAISPDGQTLAAGSSRHIKIWNAKTGRLYHKLIAHKSWIGALGISPDGQTLVSGSLDGKIKIWNLPAGKLEKTLSGKIEAINSLAISPDGETFAAGGVSGKVEIWHLPSGKLQKTFSAHSSAVNSLTTSADGKTLISGGRDSTIKMWNPKTGKLLWATSQKNGVNSVAISPDGRTLASGSGDKTIQIWQLP